VFIRIITGYVCLRSSRWPQCLASPHLVLSASPLDVYSSRNSHSGNQFLPRRSVAVSTMDHSNGLSDLFVRESIFVIYNELERYFSVATIYIAQVCLVSITLRHFSFPFSDLVCYRFDNRTIVSHSSFATAFRIIFDFPHCTCFICASIRGSKLNCSQTASSRNICGVRSTLDVSLLLIFIFTAENVFVRWIF
jgi:hypothetical protein